MTLLLVCASCGSDSGLEVQSSTDESPVSLEDFFGFDSGAREAMSAWRQSVQKDIAQCMRKEGFVYHEHVTAESSLDLKRVELAPSEFRGLYGYGIAQSLFGRVASQAVDPNLAVLSSLDANEVQAYQSALLGDAAEIVVQFVEEIPPLANQGCAGAAIIDNGGAAISEDLNDFEAALSQGYTRLQNEPEMLFAVGLWQECLAGSGLRV